MGLLSDVFSYGDSLKRKIGGLLGDPIGTIGLGITRFGEDQQGLLNNAADAGYMPGQSSVLTSPQQQAMARALLADQAAQQGIGAATVWHGSPHKFDAFDASKIGTGEGAQAYGHGLYLAEAPSVAKSYADTLSQYHIGTRDGVKSGGDFADALVANAGDYPASLSSAIRSQASKVATDLAGGKTAEQVIASMRNGPYARMYSGLADAVEKISPTKATGNLYKVDLPDEHIARMLDWDKPLSQQAPEVRKVFDDVFNNPPSGVDTFEWMRDVSKASNFGPNDPVGNFGAQLTQAVNKHLGPAKASEYLQSKGISGIKYLDGGSRNGSAGTSNYVVFPGNEGLLQILERNGQPVR